MGRLVTAVAIASLSLCLSGCDTEEKSYTNMNADIKDMCKEYDDKTDVTDIKREMLYTYIDSNYSDKVKDKVIITDDDIDEYIASNKKNLSKKMVVADNDTGEKKTIDIYTTDVELLSFKVGDAYKNSVVEVISDAGYDSKVDYAKSQLIKDKYVEALNKDVNELMDYADDRDYTPVVYPASIY